MKYEMIFGDEKLFDGAGLFTGIDVVTRNVEHGLYALCRLSNLTNDELKANPVVAMRRIISDPKRWTMEDQKAGKLPEVGCRVNFCHKFNTNWRAGEIKYIDDQLAFIKTDDIDRPFIYEVDRVEFKPIETTAEKAARLKDEFVNFVLHHGKSQINSSEELVAAKRAIKLTYELQLSGELKAPKGGE